MQSCLVNFFSLTGKNSSPVKTLVSNNFSFNSNAVNGRSSWDIHPLNTRHYEIEQNRKGMSSLFPLFDFFPAIDRFDSGTGSEG
jgi:hypothetical protein